jgi:hypothetical protein
VPALKAGPLPSDAATNRKLAQKLSALVLRTPSGAATAPVAQTVAGKRYVFDKNAPSIESIALEPAPAGGAASIALRISGVDQRITAGHNNWQKGSLIASGAPHAGAASGAWTSGDTYTLKVVRFRTPFSTTYHMRFAGDQVFVKAELNVGPVDARVSEFAGRLATGSAQQR